MTIGQWGVSFIWEWLCVLYAPGQPLFGITIIFTTLFIGLVIKLFGTTKMNNFVDRIMPLGLIIGMGYMVWSMVSEIYSFLNTSLK